MFAIEKYTPPVPPLDKAALIMAYWLMYCRAPGRATAPGETVDLGEIGQDKEKDWQRLTPYSPARKEHKPCLSYIDIAG